MRQKKESGIVNADKEKLLMERLEKECQQFLTKKAKKAFDRSEQLPESPYRPKWLLDGSGKTVLIEDVFIEVGAEKLYQLYSEMSDWVYWNPRGIGTKIRRNQESITFVANHAATALASGFQALWQVTQIVNDHFKLDLNNKIEEIRNDYVSAVSIQKSA